MANNDKVLKELDEVRAEIDMYKRQLQDSELLLRKLGSGMYLPNP